LGDGKNFADKNFLNDFFKEKSPFSRRKFLMTFLVIDLIYQVTYMALSRREKTSISEKNIVDDTIFYSVRTFARIG